MLSKKLQVIISYCGSAGIAGHFIALTAKNPANRTMISAVVSLTTGFTSMVLAADVLYKSWK